MDRGPISYKDGMGMCEWSEAQDEMCRRFGVDMRYGEADVCCPVSVDGSSHESRRQDGMDMLYMKKRRPIDYGSGRQRLSVRHDDVGTDGASGKAMRNARHRKGR